MAAIDAAVILGRHFFGLVDIAENAISIPYRDLPGFPVAAGVEDGEVIICSIDGAPTLLLKGRTTFHDTGDPSLMATPIEALSLLGVRHILCTALALSVHADLVPSSVVLITDHINFNGLNPLIGGGQTHSMINMNEAYDKRLL
ncbi:MAG: phosphorylase, partial [Methylocystis sp.]|nr:phosphorylase [Methylocystis sp.]